MSVGGRRRLVLRCLSGNVKHIAHSANSLYQLQHVPHSNVGPDEHNKSRKPFGSRLLLYSVTWASETTRIDAKPELQNVRLTSTAVASLRAVAETAKWRLGA